MPLDQNDPKIQEKLRLLKEFEDDAAAFTRHRQKSAVSERNRQLALARRDFRRFLEHVIRDEETNELIRLAEIHRTWIDHIDYCWSRGLIAGVLAPWGHGKSAIMEALPLFLFGHDPTLRIKIISSSDLEAKKRVGKIREYIDNSPEYKELFDNVKQHPTMPWTRNEIFLARPTMARDASLESKGIMSSAIGGRADVLIIDDINDQKNTITNPMDRLKVWENYTTTFLSRRTSYARAAFIACLTGDTPILLADGSWRPLTSIQPGDQVLSRVNDELVPCAVRRFIPQGEDKTWEVRTGNHTVRGNARHPFLVQRHSGPTWVKLGELRKGDHVWVRGCLAAQGEQRLDIEAAWLLGFMFGDGWITVNRKRNLDKTKTRRYSETQSIVTCFAHGSDTKLEARVLRSFNEVLGVAPKRTRFGYYRTEIARVGRWFQARGLNGKASTKRLPAWLFAQPNEVRLAFLDGFGAADGHADGRWNRMYVKLCNRDLVEDLRHLAEACGLHASNISSRKALVQPPNSPKPILAESHTVAWQKANVSSAPIRLELIRSIRLIGWEPVYDLEVENENFIAGGFVVHNTRWHKDDTYGLIMQNSRMRQGYGWLVQRIYPACQEIECSYYYPTDGAVPVPGKLDRLFEVAEREGMI